MQGLILIIVMLAVMWLLLIRPQRPRAQAQARLQESLREGQEVLTVGGLYGRIAAVRDDDVELEIAPGTRVRVDRRAVAANVPDAAEAEPEPEAPG